MLVRMVTVSRGYELRKRRLQESALSTDTGKLTASGVKIYVEGVSPEDQEKVTSELDSVIEAILKTGLSNALPKKASLTGASKLPSYDRKARRLHLFPVQKGWKKALARAIGLRYWHRVMPKALQTPLSLAAKLGDKPDRGFAELFRKIIFNKLPPKLRKSLLALLLKGATAPAKKPKKGVSSLPDRRETIQGMKVVFMSGVSEKAEKHAVDQILHAIEMCKAHRFGDAWGGGGTIFIAAKPHGAVAGTYNRHKDHLWLYPRVAKGTIIHELGHRWWYRNMTRTNRRYFIEWIKAGLAPVSHYGGKDPWEAFAEAFYYFIMGKNMTPQQVETFKLVARGGRFEHVEQEDQMEHLIEQLKQELAESDSSENPVVEELGELMERGKKHVAIFDFDGTLFLSPQKPDWFQRRWWREPVSLNPPCVPKIPDSSWWNMPLVNQAKKLISDPSYHTVMLTGRWSKPFIKRIRELLKQAGLAFDEVLLAPTPGALPFKKQSMDRLAQQFDLDSVEIWDDHPDHVYDFVKLFDRHGIPTNIKHSRTLTKPATCPGPEGSDDEEPSEFSRGR